MSRSHILKIALFIVIIVLLGNAVAISRDYQDSWVLEGLEIPFVLFVATYALAFFSEKGITWMVALAVICRSVFTLIPNLKYVWFLGRSIDQHRQFSLANYVCSEGHVLPHGQYGQYGEFYGSTPGIHIFFASFSTLTSIPVLHAFKFLPVVLSLIYPLVTYTIIKKLGFTRETSVLRYALFVSSLPIGPALSLIVTGSMFGMLLSFLALSQIVKLLRKKNLSDSLLLIILSFALVTTHSFSSLQFALLILTILVLQKFSSIRIKSYLKTSTVFLIVLLNVCWLVFQAISTLENIAYEIRNMGTLLGIYPESGVIPARFFQVLHLSIFESLMVILVEKGADAFLLLLTIVSVIFVVKNRKWSNTLKLLCSFNVLLWLLLVGGVLSRLGGFYWVRIVRFASLSYGIFFGILIVRIDKRRIRSALAVSLLVITIVLASIEFYRCQPMIGPANLISENLPADEPIVYVVSVNSIYQRKMIEFAEDYVHGPIACDAVTKNQILGLTGPDFSRTVTWFYPFSRLLGNTSERQYDYFLIHLPGRSGAFEEKAEIRTRSLIVDAISNSSIVYTNGESYILLHQYDLID